MIDSNEIRTAVDLLSKDDPEQFADGKPVLLAVQRVMQNDALTQADLDAALTTGDGGTTLTPAAPAAPVQRLAEEPGPGTGGASDDPDDRPEGIAPSDDRTAAVLAQVESLKDAKKQLLPTVEELQRRKAALDAELIEAERQVNAIDAKVEEATAQISDAEMVKLIQKQTRDRLMAQAENTKKVEAAMQVTGLKSFASPLDAALAGGAKRSKVILPGKGVYEAPHPRSPEGVKSYAKWIHHEQGSQA